MSAAFDRDVWAILGMPLDNVTLDEAAHIIERAVETRTRLSFVTPNVNWMVRALKDPSAMRQIVNADLSLADGVPVVWLAKQLGMPLQERVAGADLFQRLRTDNRDGVPPIRIFFFGGREGAAEGAHQTLLKENGRLVAAGWLNPGFGDVESMSTPSIRNQIKAANADFIIVSLCAAKGQAWIEHNQAHLNAPVIAHLGAVVDFAAGTIQRAPEWASKSGLEWVWRIIAEPSLWRRYWNDGTDLIGLLNRRMGAFKKAARTDAAPKTIQFQYLDHGVKLSGDLVAAHRAALKGALVNAIQPSGDFTLDLTEVGAIDACALGQVRMLEQCLIRRGDRLEILASQQTKPAFDAAKMTLQGVQ
jgi:N-acetylglucosaminyldiphosphoundecaprenol N-acetyl-beta-D-mannosaminyltransferase